MLTLKMNAVFRPSLNGNDVLNGMRGKLNAYPMGFPAPANATLFKGSSLATIREENNITFFLPVSSVPPASISPTQLRLKLVEDGKPLSVVLQIISQLPEPLKTQAEILWEYSYEYRHSHPLVRQIAAALGYDTDKKLNDFFIAASNL